MLISSSGALYLNNVMNLAIGEQKPKVLALLIGSARLPVLDAGN